MKSWLLFYSYILYFLLCIMIPVVSFAEFDESYKFQNV